MNILLTGSSGWLGRFLAPMLRAAGHQVTGLDVAAGANTDIIGSVADRTLVETVFAARKIEAVLHAGGLHKPDITRFSEQSFIDVNITGTLNLLRCAAAQGNKVFVFTSTTSLMISQAIRDEAGDAAVWLDEKSGPLAPRNIYGVTKLAAEGLCRQHTLDHGLSTIVLRTSRFFAEDDDTHAIPSGENLKANEFLHRRLTVEDAARAHIAALTAGAQIGHDVFIISAPPPFQRADAADLKGDAAAMISARFPDAAELYAQRGWQLPRSIGRVYDPGHAERRLGFRAQTDFTAVLDALRRDGPLPFVHDPAYVSPML
jgi:UDP-glucose 4-epimerase